jgi:hypothetical protein
MDQRKDQLTNNDTPFLYNILVGTLARAGAEVFTPEELDADHPQDPCPSPTTAPDDTSDTHLSSDECDELAYEGSVFSTATPGKQDRQARSAQVGSLFASVGLPFLGTRIDTSVLGSFTLCRPLQLSAQ